MEIAEVIMKFVKPELLVIVPVLYLLGCGFKSSMYFKDKFIPLVLGMISIMLTTLYLIASVSISNAKDIVFLIFTALTQGVLLAGASVYINQVIKQSKRK